MTAPVPAHRRSCQRNSVKFPGKRPLMIVTGGNDPRVPASEADQIVKAVRAKGSSAWHILGQNEGHSFAKKENRDYQFWTGLKFWEKTLLGGE